MRIQCDYCGRGPLDPQIDDECARQIQRQRQRTHEEYPAAIALLLALVFDSFLSKYLEIESLVWVVRRLTVQTMLAADLQ